MHTNEQGRTCGWSQTCELEQLFELEYLSSNNCSSSNIRARTVGRARMSGSISTSGLAHLCAQRRLYGGMFVTYGIRIRCVWHDVLLIAGNHTHALSSVCRSSQVTCACIGYRDVLLVTAVYTALHISLLVGCGSCGIVGWRPMLYDDVRRRRRRRRRGQLRRR